MTKYLILIVLLTTSYLLLAVKSAKTYQSFIKEFKPDEFPLSFMAPVSLYLIDKFRVMERYYGKVSILQQKIISLHGNKAGLAYTKMFVAQLLSSILLGVLASAILAVLGDGDDVIFAAGCMITVIVPVLMIRKLDRCETERKNAILMELPELVNKVILLANAGENVQRVLIRCADSKGNTNHPLYLELKVAANRLSNNEPFPLVMNDLSKKCGIQEVSVFTTTILLNYRKGGQDLVLSLRELSRDLWKKRTAITKTKGEQASSKLVFPLVMIFIAVMIIVGWPAMQLL
ncbi:MAG TPA: type II secretion system F family protein [Bacillales bacterium]|nr:type II secretion system F family protein [Bacillales bacterium]